MNCPTAIYLDGIACVGKTSVLRLLHEDGYPVAIGDYFEDGNKYPVFANKAGISRIEVAYSLYCCVKINDHTIHDRSPLSSLFYQLVFAVMNGNMSNKDIEDFCQQLPNEMWSYWGGRRYIILLDEDFSSVLTRMKRRGNGIDILSTNYVQAQKLIFSIVARHLNATILIKRSSESMSAWIFRVQTTIATLYDEISSTVLLRP